MSKDGASELLEVTKFHHTTPRTRRILGELFCSQNPGVFVYTIAVTDGILHIKRIGLRISCLTSFSKAGWCIVSSHYTE